MRGYALSVVQAVDAADGGRLEIKLARHCIRHNIPVVDVATYFGVSRQTVYNWFCKGASAAPSQRARIEAFLLRAVGA
jgi:hypothetical protein